MPRSTCALILMLAASPLAHAAAASDTGPAPQLTSLAKAFTGRWSISEQFEPMKDTPDSVSTPSAGTGHGEEIYRSGPGGFTFMEEEHNVTPQGEVYIVGYMWWDGTKRRLAGMECNSLWPQGCDLQAALSLVSLSWDGKTFVVDFRNPKDPGKLAWHEVFSDITPTSFLQVGYVGQPDGSLKKWVTIHASRMADTEAAAAAH